MEGRGSVPVPERSRSATDVASEELRQEFVRHRFSKIHRALSKLKKTSWHKDYSSHCLIFWEIRVLSFSKTLVLGGGCCDL